jgi:hypothetical protein
MFRNSQAKMLKTDAWPGAENYFVIRVWSFVIEWRRACYEDAAFYLAGCRIAICLQTGNTVRP